MHRRTFLATLGATAAAGCIAESSGPEDQPTTVAPTEAPETTETTTPRPTDEPTARPESTPTRGEVLLDRGRDHLQAAIDAFVASAEGPDPTIVDVTAASTEFSRYEVNEEYRAAKADLNDAKDHLGERLTAEANDLLQVAEFVDALGLVQVHLVNSYERVTVAVRTLYTESYDELPDDVDDVAYQRGLAAEHAATIGETFDASTFAAVDVIADEHFEAKVEQIDRELATFDGLVTHLDGVASAMEAFGDDAAKYRTNQYEGVTFSSSDFEDARDGLAAIEPAESLRPIVEELACVFEALAGGTDEMQKAVLARRNDDSDSVDQYEAEAEAAFRSCDHLIEEVGPAADLVDSI